MAYQFGGWYNNPATGTNMRYWGPGAWTTGSDPTQGLGPNWQSILAGQQQPSQPSQSTTSSPQVLSASTSNPANQYLSQLTQAQQSYNDLLKDYLGAQTSSAGFGQRLLDEIKKASIYPSASAMREQYLQNPNLTPAAIESLIGQRVNTTSGTIQDIINRASGGLQQDIAGKQSALQLAQQGINNLLQQYQLASPQADPQLQFLGSSSGGYYGVNPYTGEIVTQYGGGIDTTYDPESEFEEWFKNYFNPTPTPTPIPNTNIGFGTTPALDLNQAIQSGGLSFDNQNQTQSSISPYLDYFTNALA